jgi:hypothetical protein
MSPSAYLIPEHVYVKLTDLSPEICPVRTLLNLWCAFLIRIVYITNPLLLRNLQRIHYGLTTHIVGPRKHNCHYFFLDNCHYGLL